MFTLQTIFNSIELCFLSNSMIIENQWSIKYICLADTNEIEKGDEYESFIWK